MTVSPLEWKIWSAWPARFSESPMQNLRIRKCRQITGRTIALRNATLEDAEFIVELRANQSKNKHLGRPVSVDDQIAYLQRYDASDDQAYFIVESLEHRPLGTVRLY